VRKKSFVLWLVLALLAFALMAGGGGCGGGGGGEYAYTPSNPSPAPSNPDPTPEPEIPDGWTPDSYYEPLSFTQEELDAIYNEGYVKGTYEDLKLPDGTSVKDFIDNMGALSAGSANMGNAARPRAASANTAFGYIALMNKRGWDMTQDFAPNDPRRTRSDGKHNFGQSKYVYIWKQQDNVGEGDKLRVQNSVGGCRDGMYGVECVGFVLEATNAAGIPMPNAVGPYAKDGKLGDPAVWNNWLKKAQNSDNPSVSVVSVDVTGEPLPGDILIWDYWDGRGHVGLAAMLGSDTIVLHSNGRKNYTCAQYEAVAQGPRFNDTTNFFENVSGPQYSLYSAYTRWTKKETVRLRFKDTGTPSVPTDNWIDVADTSWYENAPLATSYTITKAEQLAGLAKLVNNVYPHVDFSGKTITLAEDIDLAGRQWTPIGYYYGGSSYHFNGTFDGTYHIIWNMTITNTEIGNRRSTEAVGLFGVSGVTVQNVNLANVHIDVTAPYTGGVVGSNRGTVSDCTSNGNITSRAPYSYSHYLYGSSAGGIVGDNDGTVLNCASSCNVTASSSPYEAVAGGVVGHNWSGGTVSGCTSNGGNVNSSSSSPSYPHSSYAGGVVGDNYGTVSDCHKSNGRVSSSITTSTVTTYATAYAGGVIGGLESGTVSDCTFSRSATGQQWGIGGVNTMGQIGAPSNDGCTANP
jgi:hypothetical protein